MPDDAPLTEDQITVLHALVSTGKDLRMTERRELKLCRSCEDPTPEKLAHLGRELMTDAIYQAFMLEIETGIENPRISAFERDRMARIIGTPYVNPFISQRFLSARAERT